MYRSDPNAIALETSGSYLSFSFLRKGEILKGFHKKVGVRHEEVFWQEFPKYWKRSRLKWGDLDFIATTKGPGRFTGVRLGLAITNIWSRVLKIPLFAPTTIDLFKWQFPDQASFIIGFSGAFSGSVSGGAIKGYVCLEDFLKEHNKWACRAKIFYWADRVTFHEIPTAHSIVPKAENLLKMAIANKNSAFFRKTPAYPIYLKKTWQ